MHRYFSAMNKFKFTYFLLASAWSKLEDDDFRMPLAGFLFRFSAIFKQAFIGI